VTIQGAGPGGAGGTTIEQTDGQNRGLEIDAPAALTGVDITGGHLAPPWASNTTFLGGGILAMAKLVVQNVLGTGNEVVAPSGPAGGDTGDNAEGGGRQRRRWRDRVLQRHARRKRDIRQHGEWQQRDGRPGSGWRLSRR
jgi:hypothetical protein